MTLTFLPLVFQNAYRSPANQNPTANNAKLEIEVDTVVTIGTYDAPKLANVKHTKPAENAITEATRNTRGVRVIQMDTHHGTQARGDRYIAELKQNDRSRQMQERVKEMEGES